MIFLFYAGPCGGQFPAKSLVLRRLLSMPTRHLYSRWTVPLSSPELGSEQKSVKSSLSCIESSVKNTPSASSAAPLIIAHSLCQQIFIEHLLCSGNVPGSGSWTAGSWAELQGSMELALEDRRVWGRCCVFPRPRVPRGHSICALLKTWHLKG